MIHIQPLRKNDISPEGGKQYELGKAFFTQFGWEVGSQHNVVLHYLAMGVDVQTTLTVRANERGGERVGADCKEYQNAEGKSPLKDFLRDTLGLSEAHVGVVCLIFEPLDEGGNVFNLYTTPFKKVRAVVARNNFDTALQTIFFGTPGSGKSHKVAGIVDGHDDFTFRTTFHPDSDYATFVGSYKPEKDGETLSYNFVPQAFTDAYVAAWKNPEESVYLVIEEINRGNCAQIFGDLFQLLDRKDNGLSEYPIKADADLRRYLESEDVLGEEHDGIKNGKLCLPANLNILATMNTSDQSLFPMDSAFKRRWSWEYVPVEVSNPEAQFKIKIGDKVYKWASFLERANEKIHDLSDSEDKQMGNFFIKSNIGVEEFKSKVMFYLWSEVCKEYEKTGSFFKDANNEDKEFTFNSLFPTNDTTISILQGFMSYLKVDLDTEATEKESKATTFVNALIGLGLDRVFENGYAVNGYPLVGKSKPEGHAFRRNGEYYIQTTVEDKDGVIATLTEQLGVQEA